MVHDAWYRRHGALGPGAGGRGQGAQTEQQTSATAGYGCCGSCTSSCRRPLGHIHGIHCTADVTDDSTMVKVDRHSRAATRGRCGARSPAASPTVPAIAVAGEGVHGARRLTHARRAPAAHLRSAPHTARSRHGRACAAPRDKAGKVSDSFNLAGHRHDRIAHACLPGSSSSLVSALACSLGLPPCTRGSAHTSRTAMSLPLPVHDVLALAPAPALLAVVLAPAVLLAAVLWRRTSRLTRSYVWSGQVEPVRGALPPPIKYRPLCVISPPPPHPLPLQPALSA